MGVVGHPGARIRELLEQKGWTQEEFAQVIGKSRQTISALIAGRAGLTPEMAMALGAAFGNEPAEWLHWASQYELSVVEANAEEVRKRARLFDLAPIREMTKRGWIAPIDAGNDDELERELVRFFGGSLDAHFPIAARRTVSLDSLNPAEKAWCFRARQLAQSILVKAFDADSLDEAERQLRKAAAYPKDAARVALILSEFGIRFVVIEPLPGAKIDGAAFWLDDCSPVIALSVRFDRMDAFWFTLFHEFAHIKNKDAMSIDVDVLEDQNGGIRVGLAVDESEKLANQAAANILVPSSEMDSFVARLAPYYSSDRVVQFAHRVKIHPGIIVGQLQHRQEIGYHALKDFLVKIRSYVIETALTDGWGHVSPRLC